MRRLLAAVGALTLIGGCAAPAPRQEIAKQPSQPQARPAAPVAGAATKSAAPDSGSISPDPQLATMAPSSAELPDFSRTRRTLPAKIGVERYDSPPTKRLVPDYSKLALTEAQKKYLAEEEAKKAKDDLLAFYRPERGTEHGVSPFDGGGQIDRHGAAGAGAGVFFDPFPKFGQLPEEFMPIGIYDLTDSKIRTYINAGRTTGLDPIPATQIGEGLRRDRSRTIDIIED